MSLTVRNQFLHMELINQEMKVYTYIYTHTHYLKIECNARATGSIPGWGTKILHAVEQLRPDTAK